MTISIQQFRMARNIFAKYSGLHKRKAQDIIDSAGDEFVATLCKASPADAKHLVEETYAAIQIADGNAAQAKKKREPNPQLGESHDGVQWPEPASRSATNEATGGNPDSLETGGPEASEGIDQRDTD